MAYVLIVEDDRDCAEMLATWLRVEGFDASCARHGLEALSNMRQRCPCVVLLDLMMPVMDGLEFRRAQLADPGLASVPVVCVSAASDAIRRAGDLRLPCLPKPLSLDDVTQAVLSACA